MLAQSVPPESDTPQLIGAENPAARFCFASHREKSCRNLIRGRASTQLSQPAPSPVRSPGPSQIGWQARNLKEISTETESGGDFIVGEQAEVVVRCSPAVAPASTDVERRQRAEQQQRWFQKHGNFRRENCSKGLIPV